MLFFKSEPSFCKRLHAPLAAKSHLMIDDIKKSRLRVDPNLSSSYTHTFVKIPDGANHEPGPHAVYSVHMPSALIGLG